MSLERVAQSEIIPVESRYPLTRPEFTNYDWEDLLLFIDVGEGTSGTSADVPRFGLEIYSVSNAILDEYIFKNKFCEIEDLFLFTDRFLAK